jgi:hypothetical protein
VIAGFGAVATQAGKEAVNAGTLAFHTRMLHVAFHCATVLFWRSSANQVLSIGTTSRRRITIREATLPFALLYCRSKRR